MKFLCDVHVSFKVVKYLNLVGHETIHVNDILSGCFTKDKDIMEYADDYGFILITKDSDFRNSFHLFGKPKKLIKISLGNIATSELIDYLSVQIDAIKILNLSSRFLIELGKYNTTVIVPKEE